MPKTLITLEFRQLALKEIYQLYSNIKVQLGAFSFLEL